MKPQVQQYSMKHGHYICFKSGSIQAITFESDNMLQTS